jgi:histone H3/H4
MPKSFISLNSVSQTLKLASPGAYTPESVLRARETAEDLVKHLAITAREIATHAGRKRVTEEEIKMAARFLLKS